MQFVSIPPGEFMMGDTAGRSDEKPVHKVTITKPFYLGKYEVTQAQWQTVMGSNPSKFKSPTNPVEQVSWNDAQGFLGKLKATFSKKGMLLGLPTEAEWEYACRAGTRTRYSFGNAAGLLGEYGWFNGNSGGKTHAFGQKRPNPLGLYDMHGSVWEWCSDWHANSFYAQSPSVDPVGPPTGSFRVVRGGAWRDRPTRCRSAKRGDSSPGPRFGLIGIRIALTPAGASGMSRPEEKPGSH